MTNTSSLMRLAQAEVDCPCDGHSPACRCGGTGKVPLVPELTRECVRCEGSGKLAVVRFPRRRPEDRYPCSDCGGTGREPVSEAEAVLAMKEFARKQWPTCLVVFGPRSVSLHEESLLVLANGKAAANGTDANTLAQALCLALGLETMEEQKP